MLFCFVLSKTRQKAITKNQQVIESGSQMMPAEKLPHAFCSRLRKQPDFLKMPHCFMYLWLFSSSDFFLECLSFLIFPWTTYLNFQSYSNFFSVIPPLSQGCNTAQLQGDNSQVLHINNVPWRCVNWQPSSDIPRQSLGRTCCLSIYLSSII